jgi:hypothetical protein
MERKAADKRAARRAELLARLLVAPCEKCQAPEPRFHVVELAGERVAAKLTCEHCEHEQTRQATRPLLDLWRIGKGVLYIVEAGGGEQAIRLSAVDSCHLKRTEDQDTIELVIHGGTWAGCNVADGPELMQAAKWMMEVEA